MAGGNEKAIQELLKLNRKEERFRARRRSLLAQVIGGQVDALDPDELARHEDYPKPVLRALRAFFAACQRFGMLKDGDGRDGRKQHVTTPVRAKRKELVEAFCVKLLRKEPGLHTQTIVERAVSGFDWAQAEMKEGDARAFAIVMRNCPGLRTLPGRRTRAGHRWKLANSAAE